MSKRQKYIFVSQKINICMAYQNISRKGAERRHKMNMEKLYCYLMNDATTREVGFIAGVSILDRTICSDQEDA